MDGKRKPPAGKPEAGSALVYRIDPDTGERVLVGVQLALTEGAAEAGTTLPSGSLPRRPTEYGADLDYHGDAMPDLRDEPED